MRIIATSGADSGGENLRARAAGVTRHLPKPFSAAELLTTLRDALADIPPAPNAV